MKSSPKHLSAFIIAGSLVASFLPACGQEQSPIGSDGAAADQPTLRGLQPDVSGERKPFQNLRETLPAKAADRASQKPMENGGTVTAPTPGAFDSIQSMPGVQTGLGPAAGTRRPSTKMTEGLTPRNVNLRPGVSKIDMKTRDELDSIARQATGSSGAIFQDADNVIVKPPMLTALIQLEKHRSPYDLDADSSTRVTLRDVLKTGLESSLDIKIANEIALQRKWASVGAFSGFLPDLTNEMNYQAIGGTYVTPAGFAVPIHNGFLTAQSGFNWTLFKGGGILHTYRQTKHDYKASQATAKGTTNDVLSTVLQNYYNLVLNEVLLQIRVKGVETTNALVVVNKDLFSDGVNTQLDVLQSQYQLSMARQQLIQQQVARREAAVKLATSINLNPEVDLAPSDRLVAKVQLVDPRLSPADLMKLAIDNRPELKRYNELRLAAKEQLKVAKSTLFPTIAAQGLVLGSGTRATSFSTQNSGTGLSTAGAGVGPVSVATLPLNSAGTGPKSFTMRSLFIIGVDAQWNLGGLGLKEISQIESAKADARRVSFEFNRALAQVYQDVRDAYLSSLAAENMIVETTDTVNYGAEQLRVSEIRLKDGIGTSLDVINAERDYINALVSKAQAIIQYNVSQAKLLHAIGRISLDTLTSNVPLRQ